MSICVEAIIQAAIDRGELDNLPYRGEPLPLDDDSGVHPEDRLSFRVLKNAGMAPPEVTAMSDLAQMRAERDRERDPERSRKIAIKIAEKESALRIRLEHNIRR